MDDKQSVSQMEADHPNNPELSKSGNVTRKSITSPSQAFSIASHIERGNIERNTVDSVVLKKYNGGLPYDKAALKANLEDWRSNASFGSLSAIVDRITPTPVQAIDSARYLTNAKLDNGSPEDDKKSEFFCRTITSAIRSWDGFKDFVTSLCQENVLMGRAAPLNLNPFSPWPKMFRGNEVFFDDGIAQHARLVPCLAAKEDLLIHEFCEFLKDGPETSRDAGWDFDACIKVVNDALPRTPGSTNSETADARRWEDSIREGNQGAAHSGAKVIQLYHTLAVEPDTKKVTHYIVNRTGKHEELFHKEERFEKMEDIVTLFCLQPGNGKYYSSKGIGRMLLNACISQERARNSMLDNLNMGGMKILVVPPNSTPTLQMKVTSPFMVVSSDGEFVEKDITSNVKDFIEADNQVSRWMEQLVGSYISGLRGEEGGPTRTAHEAVIDAQRDAQAKTAFLSRFLGQFADLVSQFTRRLCDPETTDEIAKDAQKKLKDPEQGNMSKEEIKKLSNAPAAQVIQDLTGMQNQQILAAYELFRGDPEFNQHELKMRVASAAVSPQFAQDVMLDQQGIQANEVEQIRQQLGETQDILGGTPGVPVSPRDDHATHLKVIFSDLKAAAPKIMHATPEILDHVNAQLVHSSAHIKMMTDAGAPADAVKPFSDAQKAFEQLLHQTGEAMQKQMQQRRAQGGGVDAPQAPPASPSEQPATPTPPDQPIAPPGGTLPFTEKIAVAYISQYQNLRPSEQAVLERRTGIGSAPVIAPNAGVGGEHIMAVDQRMSPRIMPQMDRPPTARAAISATPVAPAPAPPEKLTPLPAPPETK